MTRPADPALDARIEAAFGSSAPPLRRFGLLAGAVMAFAFAAYCVKMVMDLSAPGYGGESVQIDFVAFWGAARLALAGDAIGAFDPNVLRAALALPPDAPKGDLLWLYPPGWHIAVAPLGLLPFAPAYILFSLLALAAFAAALRPLAAPLPGGVPLVLAGPAVLIILMLGNNSLLWTAGLAGSLAALAQGRMALAGLLIALLTLKPQLGLLIPFALAAGGYWRTFLWAAAGAVVLAAGSTAVMGFEYWKAFFGGIRLMSELMQTDIVRFERMMTWYALVRLGGFGHAVAFPVQATVTLAAIAAVSWVWSRPGASTDLRAATLCTAIPLATPYAYHYEMTLTLVAAMFLARDGFGATRGARLWLLALWLGPVPGLVLAGLLPPALYAAPLLTATVWLCVRRAAHATAAARAAGA